MLLYCIALVSLKACLVALNFALPILPVNFYLLRMMFCMLYVLYVQDYSYVACCRNCMEIYKTSPFQHHESWPVKLVSAGNILTHKERIAVT